MTEPTGQDPTWPAGQQDSYDQQPPGQLPPYQPPPAAPPGFGMPPEPPKKKKWPWILGGLFVFCFLPLGACGALIGFGINSVANVGQEIDTVVETMFLDARNGDYAAGASAAEATGGCVTLDELAAQLEQLAPSGPAVIKDTVFVQRAQGVNLSNTEPGEEETFLVDDRDGAGSAKVLGTIPTSTGIRSFEVLLVDDLSGWKVCSVSVP